MGYIKAQPRSRQEIREIANAIRKRVGLEDQLWFPIVQFAENIMPELCPGYQFEVVPVEELGEAHGIAYPSLRLVRIREDVYLGAVDGCGRDRMTIAHEVSHIILIPNVDSVAFCSFESQGRPATYEDPEWQAKALAGELLAPSDKISNMSVEEVTVECGVSVDAAKIQLKASGQKGGGAYEQNKTH